MYSSGMSDEGHKPGSLLRLMRFHQGDFNFLLFVLVVAVAAIGFCARAADSHPVAVPVADIGAGGGSFGHDRPCHHPLEEAYPGNPYPALMNGCVMSVRIGTLSARFNGTLGGYA